MSASVLDLNTGGDDATSLGSSSGPAAAGDKRARRKRLTLSCGECKKRKLACDRNLPCQRCVRTGRKEQCSFEGGGGGGKQPSLEEQLELSQLQDRNSNDELQRLRAEVSRLKELLTQTPRSQQESDSVAATLCETDGPQAESRQPQEDHSTADYDNGRLRDPLERSPRGYYRHHALFRFIHEIPQLFQFVKAMAEECLYPLRTQEKGCRGDTMSRTPALTYEVDSTFEAILPPKEDTDILVSYYLRYFETLHRVVHIPTFKREYANFWTSERTRYPAMTALILAMISMSAGASVMSDDSATVLCAYRDMPARWLNVCDNWLRQQGAKHRKLVHCQISCLVYLAKRKHLIRKKTFWKETGSLIHDAVMDGLHYAPTPSFDSPYTGEIRRRLWAVVRELDLQNAYEHGFPTLLHSIDSDVSTISHLDDEDFDEDTKELPPSKPPSQYTATSYQFYSARSWDLRLEVSRRLMSSGRDQELTYEDVLRYTHELTQAIHSLPPWNTDEVQDVDNGKFRLLSYAFLHFQLSECILAINRPYLQKERSKFWLSENTSYHISREMLLLNTKLAGHGIQGLLTLLQEGVWLASFTLVRITMLQPAGSTGVILASSDATLDLLEQCLPGLFYYRGTHWCFVVSYAAMMLLRVHLGQKSWHDAKTLCSQRIIDLWQQSIGQRQPLCQTGGQGQIEVHDVPEAVTPTDIQPSGWLDGNYADIGINPFELEMELDDAWNTWGLLTWPSIPTQSCP